MLTEVPLGVDGSSDGLYFENSVDLFAQWEVPQMGICSIQECYAKLQQANKFTSINNTTTTTHAPSNSDSHEILYCFCRLPETDGESSVLTECSICCNWYHPQCVNSGYTTLSAAARQKSFLCPVCMHLDGQVSSLSYLPNEWNIIKPVVTKLPEAKDTAKKTGGRYMMTGRIPSKDGMNSMGTVHRGILTDADREALSGKRKRSENTSTGAGTSAAAPVSRHPLVKFKTAPAVKNKEFITVVELQQMLENECSLAIIGVRSMHVITLCSISCLQLSMITFSLYRAL